MEPQQTRMANETAYFYKGLRFEEPISPRVRVEAVEGYTDVRDDDVIVCTYPKSGTHWTAYIAWKVLCEGDLDLAQERSAEAFLEVSPAPGVNKGDRAYKPRSLEELSELPSPRVIKTHMLLSMLPTAVFEKRTRVIYVQRDPRDVAVSLYHFFKFFSKPRGLNLDRTWTEHLNAFNIGEVPYGSWQTHYKDIQENSHRTNCLILKYEEMKTDLYAAVRSVAKFLGKNLTDGVIEKITESCSFESMKKSHFYTELFRKGTIGDWKNTFTVAQSEHMAEVIRHSKEKMGLKIDYE